jgi:hypothetical protein
MGYLALLQPSSASFRAGVSGLPGTAARLTISAQTWRAIARDASTPVPAFSQSFSTLLFSVLVSARLACIWVLHERSANLRIALFVMAGLDFVVLAVEPVAAPGAVAAGVEVLWLAAVDLLLLLALLPHPATSSVAASESMSQVDSRFIVVPLFVSSRKRTYPASAWPQAYPRAADRATAQGSRAGGASRGISVLRLGAAA